MGCDIRQRISRLRAVLLVVVVLCGGCDLFLKRCEPAADLPHELAETPLPTYIIESPDVILVDAVRVVPKPPYHIQPLDTLGIQVTNTLPNAPIAGIYPVDADGTVALGFTYGSFKAEGLTIPEAKTALEEALKVKLKPPYEVTVVLAESRALQQIRGPHLVRPDGSIGLGVYGSVFIDGLTIAQAKATIEAYLGEFLNKPEISVDVSGFNSKVFYILTDGAGSGEQLVRLPITGKMTVLDAMSQVNGLSPVSSKRFVYLVRPTDTDNVKKNEEVYHINWNAIVRKGDARTNYQVLPGDRLYVLGEPLVTADTWIGRFTAPFIRLLSAVGIGDSTYVQLAEPISSFSGGLGTGIP